MRIARTRRSLVAAVSLAAAVAVATPATAFAEPAQPAPQTQSTDDLGIPDAENAPEVDKTVLDALGAFAPALIGSAATRDQNGNVNTKLLADARMMADNPLLPAEASATFRSLIDFLAAPDAAAAAKVKAADETPARNNASKNRAVEIPKGPNAPKIQQFLYPTAGFGCTPGGLFHIGMALVTAGPQEAPAPGPKRGEAGFVFTSMGTGPALNNKAAPLLASWINLDTGKQGVTTLKRNDRINIEEGPGTFTGIAKTGKGRIVTTIHGTVTTENKGKPTSCAIAPTIGTAII